MRALSEEQRLRISLVFLIEMNIVLVQGATFPPSSLSLPRHRGQFSFLDNSFLLDLPILFPVYKFFSFFEQYVLEYDVLSSMFLDKQHSCAD